MDTDTGKLVVAADTSIEDFRTKLDSMMERVDDGEYKWNCIVCGKVSKKISHARSHVETHIEGLSYPCNKCGTIRRTSDGLRSHISKCRK